MLRAGALDAKGALRVIAQSVPRHALSPAVHETLDRFFKLRERGTNIRTELIAGLTTFAAMAYILAVNPQILSASGMNFGAVVTATALASAIMTAVFALVTNWPIALAPGMGLNAFFAFTICGAMKIPWQAALAMVFLSGCGFLLLTLTGIREQIVKSIPLELKLAISAGIGMFILFIGLKNGGIIVTHPVTLVTAGKFSEPRVLLVIAGIALTAVLHARNVRGAIVIGVIVLTIAGAFISDADHKPLTEAPKGWIAPPASLAPTFMAFDFGYVFQNWHRTLPLVLAFLFVDLFDNMGTLIGVCSRLGYLNEQGELPGIGRALAADAGAAMVGATLGTSTVTSYIESAAGTEEGGRTGLTALVVSLCFLSALVLHPILQIIPTVATAPALVIVGLLMMQGLAKLDLRDFVKAVPCILTIVMMPLTFSISEGIAIGFAFYCVLMLLCGRAREVSGMAWALGVLFLAHLVTR
jgi:AGZA family xanthine/uracil permease-like MFS transporter